MDHWSKERQIVKQFIAWMKNDETYDKFSIHRDYENTIDGEELSEGELPHTFEVDNIMKKLENKPEFWELQHVEGNKHPVKMLTKEGSNFIFQNIKILNQYLTYKGMFTQNITLRDEDGITSVIGGTLSFVKDKMNYWDNISIMFSTDINVSGDEERNRKKTKKNRKKHLKIIEKSISEANRIFAEKLAPRTAEEIFAYSVIKMKGCYRTFKGDTCKERSYCINLVQVPEDLGLDLAKRLRTNFEQESVLISIGGRNTLISE